MLHGQQAPGTPAEGLPSGQSAFRLLPLTGAAPSPGVVLLLQLEGQFAQAVAEGGGKAFATWFAPDAVTLNNGKPALLGRGAIAQAATWDPKQYSLTWVAQGAQMGPSNDMGFTWGHYEARLRGSGGESVATSGRYITIWRKLADGSWKVAMDASANDSPADPGGGSAAKP